jgi:hypothetical protein
MSNAGANHMKQARRARIRRAKSLHQWRLISLYLDRWNIRHGRR